METTKKCDHETWCNNCARFVVNGSIVCSVHLASACRFALDFSELVCGDHSEVSVTKYLETVHG